MSEISDWGALSTYEVNALMEELQGRLQRMDDKSIARVLTTCFVVPSLTVTVAMNEVNSPVKLKTWLEAQAQNIANVSTQITNSRRNYPYEEWVAVRDEIEKVEDALDTLDTWVKLCRDNVKRAQEARE